MGGIFHHGGTERRSLPGSIVLATLLAFVGTLTLMAVDGRAGGEWQASRHRRRNFRRFRP